MLRITTILLALALWLPLPATASTALVEYYNASLDHYFVTWVPDEIAKLDAGETIKGWTRTGKEILTYSAAQGGASPVCRYYIPPGLGDSHFFGRGTAECDATGTNNPSFVLESSTFMYFFLPVNGVCPTGTTNVYRVFSNRPDANHRYMTETATRDQMVAMGWLAEGDGPVMVVMCAPNDTGPTTDFTPTANTTLSGAIYAGTVTIPVGVTVTLTGDAFVTATGSITVGGNITGDCKALSLTADGTLSITGNIDTHCSAPPAGDAPSLTLVGKGGYTVTGGTYTASGEVTVTNDLPSTVSAVFDASGFVVTPSSPSSKLTPKVGPYACVAVGATFILTPPRADDGADGGVKGKDGKSPKPSRLWCALGANGNIVATRVFAKHGGHGGSGTDLNVQRAADATGGSGGKGADLIVYADGDLDIGPGVEFNSGSGGRGGNANASSATDANVDPAHPATATGGKGGDAGLITVQAGRSITVTGQLTLNVGSGGDSGNATAVAADGVNSTATKMAQVGGAARATSKDAGKLPPGRLHAGGAVNVLGTVTVTGGPGGRSGNADATGGKGGDGVVTANKDGAIGGAVAAVSGRGGDVLALDMAGMPVGDGGSSGDVTMTNGNGGLGYNDCVPPPLVEGGKGGNGGTALGGAGSAGAGRANGTPGTTREVNLSNGGNGGHGFGPGLGGNPGVATIVPAGPVNVTNPVFVPGAKGHGCRFNVSVVVLNDPAPPHEGFVGYTAITILDGLVDNAASTISFTGLAGGTWIACSGPYNKATGAFTCTGAGIAAGFAGVPAVFTGTVNTANGTLTGEVALGGGAVGLPQHSVSYTVTGTVAGVTP